MKKELVVVLDFLRSAYAAGNITSSSRGYTDVFASRLARCLTEATLSAAMEHLLRTISAQADHLSPDAALRMMALSESGRAASVQAWLRQHVKLTAMLCATRDEKLLAETLASISLPGIQDVTGTAPPSGGFDIVLEVRCLSQLAHGAEGKAGNATLFRRQQVMSTTGSILSLPYYGGNAVRGQMRDLLADHYLTTLGVKPALWFFYALYSGGALEEQSAGLKAITKRLGSAGALRTQGLREFRNNIVPLSVLGCALGNRVLNGRVQVSDLRPRCKEWGSGDSSAAELMGWEYLTRREDREEHEDNHSMIANTEVLKAGVFLDGGITLDEATTSIERACIWRAVDLLVARGQIGAENRRGLGRVEIKASKASDAGGYDEDLMARRDVLVDYLRSIEAIE